MSDFTFCHKHLQYFVAEYLLKRFGINGNNNKKHVVSVETSIGNQDMQVGMKPKKIAERLYGDNSNALAGGYGN